MAIESSDFGLHLKENRSRIPVSIAVLLKNLRCQARSVEQKKKNKDTNRSRLAMKEKGAGLRPISRRDVLKAGTFFAVWPPLHLAALSGGFELSARGTASNPPANALQPASPRWMRELIVYEIATKGLLHRMVPRVAHSTAYAQIGLPSGLRRDWHLAGRLFLGDPHHFYNIWTQYAVIEPDKFDPTLGTAEEFKGLIDEAHQRHIRVFLDVITHGLMENSPVIKAHPAWFRGGTWG